MLLSLKCKIHVYGTVRDDITYTLDFVKIMFVHVCIIYGGTDMSDEGANTCSFNVYSAYKLYTHAMKCVSLSFCSSPSVSQSRPTYCINSQTVDHVEHYKDLGIVLT